MNKEMTNSEDRKYPMRIIRVVRTEVFGESTNLCSKRKLSK